MHPKSGFFRPVHGIVGMPVDVMTMTDVVAAVIAAKQSRKRLFLSTPNVNFLIACQQDAAFRASILASDLCPIDGMGLVHFCRLAGIPVSNRVTGADIPFALGDTSPAVTGGKVVFALFGGENDAANRARDNMNADPAKNWLAAGAINPGMITPANIHVEDHVNTLNAMKADFLLVALGAAKGQAWIMRNMQHLNTPVISHLGATINFLAGTINRAPEVLQKNSSEWLWRIKEEPKLFKRYWKDGLALLRLAVTNAIPLGYWLRANRKKFLGSKLIVKATISREVMLDGAAGNGVLMELRNVLHELSSNQDTVTFNATKLQFFDTEFCGLMLIAEGHFKKMTITGSSKTIRWALKKAKLDHLIG
jgi:N-acetylglucosaminyldiphosphoundecaprenol N-acetyl-beta-D-mannosaminyltransferase